MENILIVAEHELSQTGGIQTGIMNNTRRLNGKYHFDIVLFCSDVSEKEQEFAKYGNVYRIICDKHETRLQTITENLTRPIRIFFGIYKILGAKEYKAIHCHDINKGSAALLAAKLRGVPVRIAHCHNPAGTEKQSAIKKGYIYFWRRVLNACANCKIGCSVEANEYMFSENTKDATYVVNNELDFSLFKRKTKKVERGVRFIHVGRFTEQKNHTFLLDVFSGIKKEIPNATLDLVGWGELEQQIRDKIDRLGLNGFVSFHPYNADVPALMEDADFMVFPSNYEGFGRVLIEAQKMEVFCFASTIIPKTTDVGLCEYLPLENGAGYWADYIVDYICNKKFKLKKLDEEAIAEFDADKIAQKYDALYKGEMLCRTNIR